MLINFLKEDFKTFRMLGYTSEYSEEAKKNLGGTGSSVMSGTAHSSMSEYDFKEYYRDAKTLIKWYFSYLSNIQKLDAVGQVVDFIRKKQIKRVLSVGAGPGVLEYFIKELTEETVIYAGDYDSFLVENGQKLLGCDRLSFFLFDFYNDDIREICNKKEIELIVMFGASCSMDDETYIKFLLECKKSPVKYVISHEAGVISSKEALRRFAKRLYYAIGRFFRKEAPRGLTAIHAYWVTERILKKIYSKGGWNYTRSKVKPYQCVYTLDKKGGKQ